MLLLMQFMLRFCLVSKFVLLSVFKGGGNTGPMLIEGVGYLYLINSMNFFPILSVSLPVRSPPNPSYCLSSTKNYEESSIDLEYGVHILALTVVEVCPRVPSLKPRRRLLPRRRRRQEPLPSDGFNTQITDGFDSCCKL